MSEDKIKSNKLLEQIIAEAIKEVLLEDDYGSASDTLSGIGAQAMGSGGYGDPGGKTAGQVASSLAGILPIGLVPRVGQTLMWGVENMTARVIGLLKTLYAYFTKAFFPGLDALSDYEKIREDEAKQLANIDKKYAETLKQNLAVLYDLDAWGVVFLLDPTLGLGWRLLENAPAAAVSVANALTGGHAEEFVKDALESRGVRASDLGQNASMKGLFAQLGMKDMGLAEAVSDSSKLIPILKQAFNSKEFKQAVASAGVYKKVQEFATNSILNRAKLVLDKQSLEELATVPELSAPTQQALQAIAQQAQAQSLQPQEIEQMKKGALGQIKESFKKLTVKKLQASAQKDKNISGQVNNIIKQIQAMK